MKTSIANGCLLKNCLLQILMLSALITLTNTATTVDCKTRLPKNLSSLSFDDMHQTAFDFNLFDEITAEFLGSTAENFVLNKDTWMNNESPILYGGLGENKFSYVQKIFLKEEIQIIAISDIHADMKTLALLIADMIEKGYMDENLILNPQYILIGLGDYMDKGEYSLRVLIALLLIALKNPKNVILLRGNHENLIMNENIDAEIIKEFGSQYINEIRSRLAKIYDLMSSGLYVAQPSDTNPINNYLIFSHGLLDFKFNPDKFLDFDNEKLRENGGSRTCVIQNNMYFAEIKALFKDYLDIFYKVIKQESVGWGFWWHDIGLGNTEPIEIGECNRYNYKPDFIANFCKKCCSGKNRISGIVGGHQPLFAKTIAQNLNINWDDLSSAAGYLFFSDNDLCDIKTGLIGTKEIPLPGSFSFVKFVSSPNDLAYQPTYLVISKNDIQDNWSYRVVEPVA